MLTERTKGLAAGSAPIERASRRPSARPRPETFVAAVSAFEMLLHPVTSPSRDLPVRSDAGKAVRRTFCAAQMTAPGCASDLTVSRSEI